MNISLLIIINRNFFVVLSVLDAPINPTIRRFVGMEIFITAREWLSFNVKRA